MAKATEIKFLSAVKVQTATHKPTKIQFVEFTGKNGRELVQWIRDNGGTATNGGRYIKVVTPNGPVTVRDGDRVIKGTTTGDFYPIKNEVFLATYNVRSR